MHANFMLFVFAWICTYSTKVATFVTQWCVQRYDSIPPLSADVVDLDRAIAQRCMQADLPSGL